MNLIDFLIIYLACGAPLSVYYFLHNLAEIRFKSFWLKTIFVFFLWIPLAFFFLRRNKNLKTVSQNFGKTSLAKTEGTEIFYSIQKQIEKILLESDLEISIYEFREIIERYVGLTLANQDGATQILRQEAEIYRIAQAKNVELSSICFSRRNQKRLLFHQTEARKDFLRLIEKLSKTGLDRINLVDLSFKMAQILKDPEALKNLENIFAASLQTYWRQNVKRSEKDLWKPEDIRQPQPAKSVPIYLSNMNATTNLRSKD